MNILHVIVIGMVIKKKKKNTEHSLSDRIVSY